MKSKLIPYILIGCLFSKFANAEECKPEKEELIKYICPTYIKNKKISSDEAQNIWTPSEYLLTSKNVLLDITFSYGNQSEPSKEGALRGSGGTTKINHGYNVYSPHIEDGKWVSNGDFYLLCHYKNPELVLFKKIEKNMRVCDVQFKKLNSNSKKTFATGVTMCSSSEQYIEKNIPAYNCRIGQPVNK
jgi:hypothetical protein